MSKTIFVLIHNYCIGKDDPIKAWNELIDFMVSNRATFVDNDKPLTPVEDCGYD